MDFKVIHEYNRLARRGACKPFTCKYCDEPLVSELGKDDSIKLHCYHCNLITTVGLAMYQDILAVVKEHNL